MTAPLPRLVALDVGQGDALLVQGQTRRRARRCRAGDARWCRSRATRGGARARGARRPPPRSAGRHARGPRSSRRGSRRARPASPSAALWLPYGARADPGLRRRCSRRGGSRAASRSPSRARRRRRCAQVISGSSRLWPPAEAQPRLAQRSLARRPHHGRRASGAASGRSRGGGRGGARRERRRPARRRARARAPRQPVVIDAGSASPPWLRRSRSSRRPVTVASGCRIPRCGRGREPPALRSGGRDATARSWWGSGSRSTSGAGWPRCGSGSVAAGAAASLVAERAAVACSARAPARSAQILAGAGLASLLIALAGCTPARDVLPVYLTWSDEDTSTTMTVHYHTRGRFDGDPRLLRHPAAPWASSRATRRTRAASSAGSRASIARCTWFRSRGSRRGRPIGSSPAIPPRASRGALLPHAAGRRLAA